MFWTLFELVCILCILLLFVAVYMYKPKSQRNTNLLYNYDHYYDYDFFYGYLSDQFYDTVSHYSSSYETVSEFSYPVSNGFEPRVPYPEDLMEKFVDLSLKWYLAYERIRFIKENDYLDEDNKVKPNWNVESWYKILKFEDKVQPLENEISSAKYEAEYSDINLHFNDEATEIETEHRCDESEAIPRRRQLKKIFCFCCCCVCSKN